jgi:hypothetical protein
VPLVSRQWHGGCSGGQVGGTAYCCVMSSLDLGRLDFF